MWWGGVKRQAGGMGVVGWRIQHNEFTVVTRLGALKTHTLDTSLPTLLQWLIAIGCCFKIRNPAVYHFQPRRHMLKTSVWKRLHLRQKRTVYHIGAFVRFSRRHRSALQETAPYGNEPLKQCGRTSIPTCVFSKLPSLVTTVNSLCLYPPSYYSHPTR